jgi:hypothetical protein
MPEAVIPPSIYGWRPDPEHQVLEDERLRRFDAAVAAATMGSGWEDDCLQPVRFVRNQHRAPSCCGQALASVSDALAPEGAPASSAINIWWDARRRQGLGEVVTGTHLFLCAESLVLRGVDAMEEGEDLDEDRWTRQPGLDDEMDAFDRRVPATRRYRIVEDDADRLDAVEAAVRPGYGVVFGTDVGEGFERAFDLEARGFDPESLVLGTDALAFSRPGHGHAMRIFAVRRRRGVRQFGLVNSWGLRFGFNGVIWVTEAVIASRDSRDFQVVMP